jgi:phospholipid/cholesterol/gamma-HCH transport system substrate-binding protein
MRMIRTFALTGVGLVALSACDLSVTSMPLPGGADLGDNPYTVTVEFRDVLDLVPQSSVKVDDVTVGKVESIDLKGYTAVVKVKVRGDVDLPDNAIAEIRQTSLLGEKFVQLAPPQASPTGRLSNGDRNPLDRSGRNPEVEEVLGALSLVLNGGGVAQLKTIATEVNQALSGRETDVKSVLRRISSFMKQVDDNKGAIITALDHVNDLSVSLNKQKGTLDLALADLPKAISSIDGQRDDLVKMLKALANLSDVGTRVISASKASTIDSLEALAPTLNKLAEAGDDFPRSLEIALTYPFVDAIVGRNAQQARDWHMGDYTNLSIQLDLDLRKGLPSPPGLPGGLSLTELLELCTKTPLDPLCKSLGGVNLPPLPVPSVALPTIGLPGLPRTAPEVGSSRTTVRPSGLLVATTTHDVDPELGAVLTWGMVQR